MAEGKKAGSKPKSRLATQNIGEHPNYIDFPEGCWEKHNDYRYGTNPDQSAAGYSKKDMGHEPHFNPVFTTFLTTLKEERTGKEGASQTNAEDMLYGAITAGYFEEPTVVVMKHENPCGVAVAYENEPLVRTFRKAREADFRAAFGGVVVINRPVDMETARAIQELFTEALVAPDFDEGVVGSFERGSIRIFKYDEDCYSKIPRYTDDPSYPEIKRLPDGTAIHSDVFLTPIRTVGDLVPYTVSDRHPTPDEMRDLLTAYRIGIRLRSNAIAMVKDGYTTGLGTGQQDRIMCVEIADYKRRRLLELAQQEKRKRPVDYGTAGSVMASDGFFPFRDCIDYAHELGVTAILAPHGGQRFESEVLPAANEHNIAFVDLPEELRFFDHH